MRAPMFTFVVGLVSGCGPAVPLEPDAETEAEGSGGSNGTDTDAPDTITSTSSAPQDDTGEGEADAEVDSGDGASSEGGDTGPQPWPAEGNGTWLCSGFEDPILLVLEVPESGAAVGRVCVADGNPPEAWPCGELFDHANIFQTSIYFAAMFEHSLYPQGQVVLEMGVDYVAESDTLVGLVVVNGTTAMETCERYVP